MEIDLTGIGVGPANLSLAALLTTARDRGQTSLSSIFLERNRSICWHSQQMFPGTLMQTEFYRDLVTPIDPTSRFSFLNYLKLNTRLEQFFCSSSIYPPRREFEDFVARVAEEGSADFVPLAKRIAVFDNDGTLWPEQPAYIQFVFARDRVKALVAQHQEWRTRQPFQAVLEGNVETLVALGESELREIIIATHSGMTTDQFSAIVADWLATTKDRRFKRLYTQLVYQPMLELLAYLRTNGFKIFIVSVWLKISYASSPTRPIVFHLSTSWVRPLRRIFRCRIQARFF